MLIFGYGMWKELPMYWMSKYNFGINLSIKAYISLENSKIIKY
jgi:hypothetical protein